MPERDMPNLAKSQEEHVNTEFALFSRPAMKGISASLLCLAVLAGCASTAEISDTAEAAPNIEAAEVKVEKTETEAATPEDNQPPTEVTSTDTTDTADATVETVATTALTAETAAAASTAEVTPTETVETTAVDTDIIETPGNEEAEMAVQSAITEPVQAVDTTPLSEPNSPSTTTPGNEPIDTLDSAVPAPEADALAASIDTAALNETSAEAESTAVQVLPRTNKNLGKSYGIWKLKAADNNACKLKTPTLQIGNKEYSSQIWLDIEEHQMVVNAYMPLDISHPKTGIKINNQALIPFTKKANSTRAIITGDLTTQLASGQVLSVLINGKEIGKKVLKRNVKLNNMSNAITALNSCQQ